MEYPKFSEIDFEKMKPYLIEAFTSVYGEHNRKIIVERINSTYVNFYLSYYDIKSYFYDLSNNTKKNMLLKMINTLLSNINISNTDKLWKLFVEQPDVLNKLNLLIPIEKTTTNYPTSDEVISIYDYRIVELFDKTKYSILDKEQKRVIDKRRIDVLNGLGVTIDEEEYYNCLNNDNLDSYVIKIKPYIDLIKELDREYDEFLLQNKDIITFIKDNEELNNTIEINEQSSTYQHSKKFIDSLGLITKNGFDFESIKNDLTACVPGIASTNNELNHICLINFPRLSFIDKGKRDLTFVHEIQHAIETELMDVNENYAVFKSGFELEIIEEFKGKPEIKREEGKRKFELMSETIHQSIAKEVTDYLHKNGIYIFGQNILDNDQRIIHTCSYDNYYEIVKPLLLKDKQTILDARLSIDAYKRFVEIFSEERLMQLNELVKLASNLSTIIGINKESDEYKNLVNKANSIFNDDIELTSHSIK